LSPLFAAGKPAVPDVVLRETRWPNGTNESLSLDTRRGDTVHAIHNPVVGSEADRPARVDLLHPADVVCNLAQPPVVSRFRLNPTS
jgi:hypothetical protein